MDKVIEKYVALLKNLFEAFDKDEIIEVANILIKARDEGKTIFVMGNGGSGLAASHFVADIGKSASYGKNKRFKVVCLNDNMSMLMSYANDVSYKVVFLEQLKNLFSPGDIVIGFSGSGNSENVIKAIEYANDNGGITVGFTGYDGGKLKQVSNYSVNSGCNDIQISEDFHLMMIHLLMKMINEKDLNS